MAGPKNRSRLNAARDLLIHLRLHYQVLLAPIFVWGYFLSGRYPDAGFWLAFVAFHCFLYGGITAFNSYYDRDQGPVGGLIQPPPVSRALLPFSLAVQGVGLILAALVNVTFLAIYLVIFGLGLAYSHPRLRLKSRPLAGLAVVGLGQGVLASLGGWVAAQPLPAGLDLLSWAGILAISLMTVGFYPLTQLYQIEEDLARGDLTFAAWTGPRGTFLFAGSVQALAAILLVLVVWQVLGPLNALIVTAVYGMLLLTTLHWARTFNSAHILDNYRRLMGINAVSSLGFLGFVGLHLFHIFW